LKIVQVANLAVCYQMIYYVGFFAQVLLRYLPIVCDI
jgi:hypothetical protein